MITTKPFLPRKVRLEAGDADFAAHILNKYDSAREHLFGRLALIHRFPDISGASMHETYARYMLQLHLQLQIRLHGLNTGSAVLNGSGRALYPAAQLAGARQPQGLPHSIAHSPARNTRDYIHSSIQEQEWLDRYWLEFKLRSRNVTSGRSGSSVVPAGAADIPMLPARPQETFGSFSRASRDKRQTRTREYGGLAAYSQVPLTNMPQALSGSSLLSRDERSLSRPSPGRLLAAAQGGRVSLAAAVAYRWLLQDFSGLSVQPSNTVAGHPFLSGLTHPLSISRLTLRMMTLPASSQMKALHSSMPTGRVDARRLVLLPIQLLHKLSLSGWLSGPRRLVGSESSPRRSPAAADSDHTLGNVGMPGAAEGSSGRLETILQAAGANVLPLSPELQPAPVEAWNLPLAVEEIRLLQSLHTSYQNAYSGGGRIRLVTGLPGLVVPRTAEAWMLLHRMEGPGGEAWSEAGLDGEPAGMRHADEWSAGISGQGATDYRAAVLAYRYWPSFLYNPIKPERTGPYAAGPASLAHSVPSGRFPERSGPSFRVATVLQRYVDSSAGSSPETDSAVRRAGMGASDPAEPAIRTVLHALIRQRSLNIRHALTGRIGTITALPAAFQPGAAARTESSGHLSPIMQDSPFLSLAGLPLTRPSGLVTSDGRRAIPAAEAGSAAEHADAAMERTRPQFGAGSASVAVRPLTASPTPAAPSVQRFADRSSMAPQGDQRLADVSGGSAAGQLLKLAQAGLLRRMGRGRLLPLLELSMQLREEASWRTGDSLLTAPERSRPLRLHHRQWFSTLAATERLRAASALPPAARAGTGSPAATIWRRQRAGLTKLSVWLRGSQRQERDAFTDLTSNPEWYSGLRLQQRPPVRFVRMLEAAATETGLAAALSPGAVMRQLWAHLEAEPGPAASLGDEAGPDSGGRPVGPAGVLRFPGLHVRLASFRDKAAETDAMPQLRRSEARPERTSLDLGLLRQVLLRQRPAARLRRLGVDSAEPRRHRTGSGRQRHAGPDNPAIPTGLLEASGRSLGSQPGRQAGTGALVRAGVMQPGAGPVQRFTAGGRPTPPSASEGMAAGLELAQLSVSLHRRGWNMPDAVEGRYTASAALSSAIAAMTSRTAELAAQSAAGMQVPAQRRAGTAPAGPGIPAINDYEPAGMPVSGYAYRDAAALLQLVRSAAPGEPSGMRPSGMPVSGYAYRDAAALLQLVRSVAPGEPSGMRPSGSPWSSAGAVRASVLERIRSGRSWLPPELRPPVPLRLAQTLAQQPGARPDRLPGAAISRSGDAAARRLRPPGMPSVPALRLIRPSASFGRQTEEWAAAFLAARQQPDHPTGYNEVQGVWPERQLESPLQVRGTPSAPAAAFPSAALPLRPTANGLAAVSVAAGQPAASAVSLPAAEANPGWESGRETLEHRRGPGLAQREQDARPSGRGSAASQSAFPSTPASALSRWTPPLQRRPSAMAALPLRLRAISTVGGPSAAGTMRPPALVQQPAMAGPSTGLELARPGGDPGTGFPVLTYPQEAAAPVSAAFQPSEGHTRELQRSAPMELVRPGRTQAERRQPTEPIPSPEEWKQSIHKEVAAAVDAQLPRMNLEPLVDKIYSEIEKKISFEQQRRGF